MPRTLVTGATGFIGSHVTRLLVQRGDAVRVTVRPGSNLEALDGLDVETVTADILDRRAMRRAMRGVDRVFHLAGTTRLRAPRAQLYAVAVQGTRIVLEEALRADAQRVVHTSSVAALGPAPKGRNADERNRWRADRLSIPYLDAMHDGLDVALSLVPRGLPLVAVLPAHVLGAGDPGRSSTVLVRRFMRRQIPAYVEGTVNIVGVQDVARAHLLADQHGGVGETYILGNRNFTTTRLFADLARLSGVAPPPVKLPVLAALQLAQVGERVGPGWLPTPTEVRVSALRWSFSNRKAITQLGWRTSPHEDCLEETIAWYRSRDGESLAPPGTGQPLALRIAGGALRRIGVSS